MERRFRRQESASSGAGSLGLLRREMPGGSTNQSRHHSQVFAINKEWQDYITAVEGDHTELRQLYQTQNDELLSLRSLLAEQPLKDAFISSLTNRVKEYESCLNELLVVLTSNEKLRERDDQNKNKESKKGQSSDKKHTKDFASHLGTTSSTGVALMDAVRDAAMRQQQSILDCRRTIERNQAEFREMERKLAAMTCECVNKKGNIKETCANPIDSVACDCFIPSSAKELAKLRAHILDLERQLGKSKEDGRSLMAELKITKHEVKVSSQSTQRYAEQLDGLRALLDEKEKLINGMQTQYLTMEKNLKSQQRTGLGSTHSLNDGIDVRTSGVDEKLIVTHHNHLLAGKEVVLAFLNAPEESKEAFLSAASTALHLPRQWISISKTQLIGDKYAVSIDIDVQHGASIEEGTIDSLLLDYPYHELQPLKERALVRQLELIETTAHDAKEALLAKTQQAEMLQKRVDGLQRLLGQRNRNQESVDRELGVALEEAEITVQSVYAGLEAQRLETEKANAALQKEREAATVQLQKLHHCEKQLEDAHRAMEATQSRLKTVEGQLVAAEQKAVSRQLLQAPHQGKPEQQRDGAAAGRTGSAVETFALRLPLPLTGTSEADAVALFTAGATLEDLAQEKRSVAVATLYRLLLCEASMTTGTVPVRISRVSMTSKKSSPTQALSLDLKLELSCFRAADERETVCQSIAQKLSSCSFHYSLRYLQEYIESSRRLTNTVQGLNTPSCNTKMSESSAQISTSSLQQLVNTLENQLDGALTPDERRTAAGVQTKAGILIERLRTLETDLQHSKVNEKKLIEEGHAALEGLREELQSTSQRCEDLQRQLLEMETDMNDFTKIQASLQTSLDTVQSELRAKKQDCKYLKQHIRKMEEETERLKGENKRLRASFLPEAAGGESSGPKGRDSDSGAAKSIDPAETKSVMAALHQTRTFLQDILRTMQVAEDGASNPAGELAAVTVDLPKASKENYRLAQQLHRVVTTRLLEWKSLPAQPSSGGAAVPRRPVPAATPTPTETAKPVKKAATKPRIGGVGKGPARIPATTAEGQRSKVRGNKASRSGSGSPEEPRSSETAALTREQRFVSPLSRPPRREGGGDAALCEWILPAASASSGFHRSHTTNDRLGASREGGKAQPRGDRGQASQVLYTRALSGYYRR